MEHDSQALQIQAYSLSFHKVLTLRETILFAGREAPERRLRLLIRSSGGGHIKHNKKWTVLCPTFLASYIPIQS